MTRPPQRPVLLVFKTKAYAWFLMRFRGVDPANHFTTVQRSVQVCDISTPALGPLASCDPTEMTYRVIRMPAGRYVLSDFELHEDNLRINTNFVGAPEVLPFAGMHGPGFGKPPALVAFDVAPGRATYIGDFNWDPETVPANFTMDLDVLAARAALAAFPLISAPLFYQPVTVLPVAAYPTQG